MKFVMWLWCGRLSMVSSLVCCGVCLSWVIIWLMCSLIISIVCLVCLVWVLSVDWVMMW